MIDVLLNEMDIARLWDKHCTDNPFDWDGLVAKAAQRKLLGVLNEHCPGHDFQQGEDGIIREIPIGTGVVNGKIHGLTIYRHMEPTLRRDCPKCMAEIEEAMK